ncbi:MAG: purD, partial [Acidobacteria bacterium]|nr:purD [Acidobacteriota bacterium]
MTVLVVGGGGREHALVWALSRDRSVSRIICAPGNAGIADLAACMAVDVADPQAVLSLAAAVEADLTIVGPELPLTRGVVNAFAAAGRAIVGPTREAAADGLAAGKGVVVAPDRAAAEAAVREAMVARRFGDAGDRLVIEEFLEGREASFFVVTDGRAAVTLPSAEDHKRAFDRDQGPNTGGMGAFAPSPLIDAAASRRVLDEIVYPVIEGMRAEGREFRGFLYVGLMMTRDGPKVVEF